MTLMIALAFAMLAAECVVPEFLPIPTPVQLLVVSCSTIYIGAFRSATYEKESSDAFTHKDAYMFPVIASAALFSLYLLIRILSKEWVNYLLLAYMILVGFAAISHVLRPIVVAITPTFLSSLSYSGRIPIRYFREKDDSTFTIDGVDVIRYGISAGLCWWYLTTKYWVANNIFGMAFAISGVEVFALGSVAVGAALLGGLFVYDIFWVFMTDVMVTVAKSIDAPIKFLFPKDLTTTPPQFSMLGLGDVVLPGVFIALLLRMDLRMAKEGMSSRPSYFAVCFVFYTLGLVLTVVVMNYFNHAQPALLYLVPACLGSTFLLALLRGHFPYVWSFTETDPPTSTDPSSPSATTPSKQD